MYIIIMSTYLYISKKCPYCERLMKEISSEEIINHMEIINVDVQKPISEHKITHVPTIVIWKRNNSRKINRRVVW